VKSVVLAEFLHAVYVNHWTVHAISFNLFYIINKGMSSKNNKITKLMIYFIKRVMYSILIDFLVYLFIVFHTYYQIY